MRCGVCGQRYGDLISKHGYSCQDDRKAKPQPICGDCLAPLAECVHSYYLRQEK